MNSRLLTSFLALLIFVAHLDCAIEHQLLSAISSVDAMSVLSHSKSSNTPSLPSESEECEHDCICKGATLVDGFELPVSDTTFNWLHGLTILPRDFAILSAKRSHLRSTASSHTSWQPFRAADRCALLQSFLI